MAVSFCKLETLAWEIYEFNTHTSEGLARIASQWYAPSLHETGIISVPRGGLHKQPPYGWWDGLRSATKAYRGE